MGLQYKFTSLVCELKKEDLVLEAQINFPYENFPNMPVEIKRPRSTLLFIDLNKFLRKKKNRGLKKPTDPHNIYFHDPLKED